MIVFATLAKPGCKRRKQLQTQTLYLEGWTCKNDSCRYRVFEFWNAATVWQSIVVPRLSAGLSAVGVLAMDLDGIAPHLLPHSLFALPPALVAEAPKARASEAQMVAFINRLNPTSGCYRTADGQLIMPVTTVNRRLLSTCWNYSNSGIRRKCWGL
jgi:hypothetical protein